MGPDDPKRSPRPPKGGYADKAPDRTIKRSLKPADAREKLAEFYREHGPSTFNAATITLYDLEACSCRWGPLDDALWDLVAAGELEHTAEAPVLFRAPTGDEHG